VSIRNRPQALHHREERVVALDAYAVPAELAFQHVALFVGGAAAGTGLDEVPAGAAQRTPPAMA
jgi:hypothetical protein